jgi:DNA repair protein RecO (recombination protein O)
MEELDAFSLAPARLACGFYVNELALKLLPRHIPMDGLVAEYAEALARLSDAEAAPEAALRRYELNLLRHLGEGLDTLDLEALDPDRAYVYEAQRGLRHAAPAEVARNAHVRGAALRALLQDRLESREQRREARRLLRGLLDYHLQGRTIASRALLRPRTNDQTSEPGDVPTHDA